MVVANLTMESMMERRCLTLSFFFTQSKATPKLRYPFPLSSSLLKPKGVKGNLDKGNTREGKDEILLPLKLVPQSI